MEILSLKPKAFGLDVSDSSLKIACLEKRKEGFGLSSYGEGKVKSGIIKNGYVRNEKELAKIIKNALKNVKGKKLKTRYVVASLPEERAFLQVIKMPRIAKEDLKSAVIYEAENYIPLPLEKVYLDYQIIPPVREHSDHFNILISAIPKKIVDPYFQALKLANLEPVALEVESQSVARALIKNGATDSPLLLIDMGENRTGFIIFSGHSLRFTSSIPVSSNNLTRLISRHLGVPYPKAERLKIKYGLEEKVEIKIKEGKTNIKKERGRIFEALVPALVDLVQQIKKYLDYYQSHDGYEDLPSDGKRISKILLCGGGANLKGISKLLSLELKTPVEKGNPWINISPESRAKERKLSGSDSLRYTTVLGLALRGAGFKTEHD